MSILYDYKCLTLPSDFNFVVHTALGFPGNSETAISEISRPCLKIRKVDPAPLPHKAYN